MGPEFTAAPWPVVSCQVVGERVRIGIGPPRVTFDIQHLVPRGRLILSFLYCCVLIFGQVASGFAMTMPAADTVPAAAPSLSSQERPGGNDMPSRPFAEEEEPPDAPESATGKSSAEEDREGAAIPGAFVAVIFGVFGLLVIARRSQR